MKRLIFSLAFIATFAIANAQVTIGTDKEPSKAALLDIKDQNSVSAGGVTSTTGGLLLPRVNLVNLGDLEPFIAGGGDAAEKANHKGLVVYNLTSNASFKQGLYTWDGTSWILAGEGIAPTITASNGLTKNVNNIELGGNLTKATTINMNGNAFGITTGAGQRLDITGNLETDYLYVNNAPSTAGNSRALVLNQVTKQIETAIDIPTSMTFLQSGTEDVFGSVTQSPSQTRTEVIPWYITNTATSTGGDMVTNNMMDYVSGEEAFKLREDANIEISGYVGYISNSTGSSGTIVSGDPTIINASLQIKRSGSSTWEDYTSVRGVYTESMTPYRQTLNIPPAMVIGKAGDMVRMVLVIRPGGLGNRHPNARVVVPFGTKFSKSLKIVSAGKGTT